MGSGRTPPVSGAGRGACSGGVLGGTPGRRVTCDARASSRITCACSPPSFSRAQAGQPRGLSSLNGTPCLGQRISAMNGSDLRQRHALLRLVFPLLVLVGDLTLVLRIRLEEQHLGDAFVGVDTRGQGDRKSTR